MVPENPPDMDQLSQQAADPKGLHKNLPVTGVAHHHVKWEHKDDFRAWCSAFRKVMESFPGFLNLATLHGKGDGLEHSQEFVNIWRFQTLSQLDAFVKSDDRLRMIRQLGPWPESPSQVHFAQDRYMHDASSEPFVQAGQDAPPRPPPVWKTTILVILGLMMCVWPVNGNVGPILAENDLKPWLQTLILIGTASSVGIHDRHHITRS